MNSNDVEKAQDRCLHDIFSVMWYYLIMDASNPKDKKFGIAEVGHTSHKWRGL